MEGFLKEVEVEETPLGAFVLGERRRREERERVLAEGRARDGEEGRCKGRPKRDDNDGEAGKWDEESEADD